jgi:hypothetical protein
MEASIQMNQKIKLASFYYYINFSLLSVISCFSIPTAYSTFRLKNKNYVTDLYSYRGFVFIVLLIKMVMLLMGIYRLWRTFYIELDSIRL